MDAIEGINIAVEGCFHGNADEIFGTIEEIQNNKRITIDLLLVCGDVQTHRNKHDMFNMSCPPKYLQMGSFYKYYTGERVAPCLTIFIGGNHEASNYLREMYFGGWVAPNIYYLGESNIINVRKGNVNLKLGGSSGIFKIFDFNNPKLEKFPFAQEQLHSVYHTKQFDIFKFSLYEGQVNMFLSHDWPQSIHQHGDLKGLLQRKKHFTDDIKSGRLGSQPHKYVLQKLQPNFWFAAHMHVKFEALVKHNSNKQTRFLALDKCLPGRDFLQLLTYTKDGTALFNQFADNEEKVELFYDAEWLAIVNATYKLLTIWDKMPRIFYFEHGLKEYQLVNKEKYAEFMKEKQDKIQLFATSDLKIPLNFKITAPPYDGKDQTNSLILPARVPLNNQMYDYLKRFNESGQELNGLIYFEPEQPRIIGEFVAPDLVQKQIEKENQQEIIQQQQLTFPEPSSPKDDELKIQDFPFLQ